MKIFHFHTGEELEVNDTDYAFLQELESKRFMRVSDEPLIDHISKNIQVKDRKIVQIGNLTEPEALSTVMRLVLNQLLRN